MGNSESCCICNRNSYKVSGEKGFDRNKEVENMDFATKLSSIIANKKKQKVSKMLTNSSTSSSIHGTSYQ